MYSRPVHGQGHVPRTGQAPVHQFKGAVKGILNKLFGNQTHVSYKMVLIGETGSGKTSFLNLLCNFSKLENLAQHKFDEKSIKEFKPFHDVSVENAADQMESKTSDAVAYEISLAEGVTLKIIDTPGFGDTRGLEKDKENVEKIVKTLESEQFIQCICLVINGRQSRISPSLQYVLTETAAILPKEVLNNLVVIFTNTADPMDLSFDVKVLTRFLGASVNSTFFVDNPFCKLQKGLDDGIDVKFVVRSINKAIPDTVDALEEMIAVIKDFKAVHTKKFADLHQKKQETELKVLSLLTAYDTQRKEEEKLKTLKAEIAAAEGEKELYRNFTSVQSMPKTILVAADHNNILCGAKDCASNCHIKCKLRKFMGKGPIRTCEKFVFKTGLCKICGHSYKLHYHNKGTYSKTTETKSVNNEVMKKKFDDARSMEEKKRILQETCKKAKDESERKRKIYTDQLLQAIDEYEELGINRSYAKLVQNQLAVIEQRLEGTVGEETSDLKNTKEILERKLAIVLETLKIPFSSEDQKWACRVLGLTQPFSYTSVDKAYRDMAKSEHPDKGGDEERFKRITRARDILMKR